MPRSQVGLGQPQPGLYQSAPGLNHNAHDALSAQHGPSQPDQFNSLAPLPHSSGSIGQHGQLTARPALPSAKQQSQLSAKQQAQLNAKQQAQLLAAQQAQHNANLQRVLLGLAPLPVNPPTGINCLNAIEQAGCIKSMCTCQLV